MSCYIRIRNVSLEFPIYSDHTKNWRSSLKNLTSAGNIHETRQKKVVTAVKNLSLDIHSMDRIALIGGNGAGKTTLLKVISGIYSATEGSVETSGRMTTLLGTGFGLDDEATGYQNILLGGVILGHSLKEVKSKISDIEQFTELGEFLNLPLRTYSAGMRSRLAFAISTCLEPEILLIDEGIGTGDASFFQKAQKRINRFLNNANILILASHSNETLRMFCNKGLVLKNGITQFFGPMEEALQYYDNQY